MPEFGPRRILSLKARRPTILELQVASKVLAAELCVPPLMAIPTGSVGSSALEPLHGCGRPGTVPGSLRISRRATVDDAYRSLVFLAKIDAVWPSSARARASARRVVALQSAFCVAPGALESIRDYVPATHHWIVLVAAVCCPTVERFEASLNPVGSFPERMSSVGVSWPDDA